MSVFGVYNIKGGVGKTASAVNLAWLAASEGARTLVWDLDPQGAASFYFRIKPKVKGGASGLIASKDRVRAAIKATDYDNLDLLPADLSYRYLDLELSAAKKPLRAVRRVLKALKQDYDHIFVDCAPNISLLSESLFASVDTLLVPMIPTTLSVRTLHQLTDLLADNERQELRIIPFFTMVDRRKKLHVQTIRAFLDDHVDVLQSYIPYSADVERMGSERAVLAQFAPRSSGMTGMRGVWSEVKARLG